MVTLSVEELPVEKSNVKLPAIHEQRAKQGKEYVGRH
jgi:hypothetical protein